MLGTRVAAKPIELGIPITIARMSSIALTWGDFGVWLVNVLIQ
jgi:hypothetical protein